jgi:hypothetical protein
MASKYDPLQRFLSADPVLPLTLSFAQVEQIVGFQLPDSARMHPAWWANEKSPTHSHAMSWLLAGVKAAPNMRERRVTFSS